MINPIRTHSARAMSRHSDGSLGLRRDLTPLDSTMELSNASPMVKLVYPPQGFALIAGIRVFNRPKEVEIRRLSVNSLALTPSRFDAAVYNLGDELPPLEPGDEPYLGELLRYCAVNWPVIDRTHPLEIEAVPFGNPAVCPTLDAVLIVQLENPTTPYRTPPFGG